MNQPEIVNKPYIEPDPEVILEPDPGIILNADPVVTLEPDPKSMAEFDPSASELPARVKAYLIPNRHDRRRAAAKAWRQKRAGK